MLERSLDKEGTSSFPFSGNLRVINDIFKLELGKVAFLLRIGDQANLINMIL